MVLKNNGQEVNKDIDFFGFLHDLFVYNIEVKNNQLIMTIGDYYKDEDTNKDVYEDEYKLVFKYIDGYEDPIDDDLEYIYKIKNMKIEGRLIELKEIIEKKMVFKLFEIGYMYNEFFMYGVLINKKNHHFSEYRLFFKICTNEEYAVSQIELINLKK